MKLAIVALLSAYCLQNISADISVNDYIFWKKKDILSWHQFFPLRTLEEERLTMEAAVTAVNSLASGLNDSLSSIVAFQAQELQTALLLTQGTDAQGCVEGITHYMQSAIDDEIQKYQDCAADALSKLNRLNSTWAKAKSYYLTAYQRALSGIDVCAKTYPNKDSIGRLISCVESMIKNYFSAANSTRSAMFPSPSMDFFQRNVLVCASTAAQTVSTKGFKFLNMLVGCARLSEAIDIPTYSDELNKWKGYNDTLNQQIVDAQYGNYWEVMSVEVEMQDYYDLQKEVLEQYVIDSRGLDYYLKKNFLLMSDYYNTMTATSLDNPGDSDCAETAKVALDAVASDGATKSLSCDMKIVNNTKLLLADVIGNFQQLNDIMPTIGNVAILKCFSESYVFAPNTIANCFNLVHSQFDIDHSDRRSAILDGVTVLHRYFTSFYNGTDLPCDGSSHRRLLLGGDIALYQLQRCLYIGSGTTYSVSTPNPLTSSTVVPPSVSTDGQTATAIYYTTAYE